MSKSVTYEVEREGRWSEAKWVNGASAEELRNDLSELMAQYPGCHLRVNRGRGLESVVVNGKGVPKLVPYKTADTGVPWKAAAPALKVFTCVGFKGHWPVGTSAVVVATDLLAATQSLTATLKAHGLPQDREALNVVEIDLSVPGAHILQNGDY